MLWSSRDAPGGSSGALRKQPSQGVGILQRGEAFHGGESRDSVCIKSDLEYDLCDPVPLSEKKKDTRKKGGRLIMVTVQVWGVEGVRGPGR